MNKDIIKNLLTLPSLLAILLPIFYFIISWTVNWSELAPEDWTISISYLFDFTFAICILGIFRKKDLFGNFILRNFIIRLVLVMGVAFVSITILHLSEALIAPFKHVDFLFIQILLLAPIIEELVYRGAIYELLEKAGWKRPLVNFLNALLFALSHGAALFLLPDEFHSFIYFQMQYTFVLGYLCAKSRERTGGVMEPILLHFLFNLTFYIAVKIHIF